MATLTKPLATDIHFPKTESLKDAHKTMNALEWHGAQDVRVVQRPRPLITEPTDVIVRITSTTICGSDLHLYHNEMSGMQKGDIMGHEGMGIIEAVGDEVKNLRVGDRVVISAVIACGQCYYCKNQMFSCCDNTNPSMEMEALYGHRTAGLFGYSHLTGGYEGCQAEWVRVPIGDMNCLKVPAHLSDDQVIFLSDIACTGWHATELGNVSEGQTVAIWGCGPVGLMAVMWSKFKKAGRVIAIDAEPYRLDWARKLGAETINFGEKEVTTALRELCPGGPDVCIEAVGFRFPKTLSHKIQRAIRVENDSPDILSECIKCCRKGGYISIVGDYYAFANRFPIGAFMEKSLHAAGGQVFVQKYWKELLGYIESGKVDLTWGITHRMPIDQAAEAYRLFDQKEDKALKIILKTGAISTD